MIAAGVHYLPPDRKSEGLVLDRERVGQHLPRHARSGPAPAGPAGARGRRRRSPGASGSMRRMLRRLVSHLSGGNQQKVLFGKGFGRDYAIYVFDEPTVGVDMGTRGAALSG